MKTEFWKMHGAGNDFILLNALEEPLELSRATIAAWCRRRTGIGADGLILLHPPAAGGHLRMQFFNPDGQEVDMCGNGARCLARLAHDLELAPAAMTMETAAGPLQAEVLPGGAVRLRLPPPRDCRLDQRLALDGEPALRYSFANTGVPHVVIECDDLDAAPVATLGRRLRQHAHFAPQGTNVNFIRLAPPATLYIRTYERGVEAETLACGTGIAAAAATAVLRGRLRSPVGIYTAGGDRLEVSLNDGQCPTALYLTGPAVYTFRGRIAEEEHA